MDKWSHQPKLENDIRSKLVSGKKRVLAQLATGGGKTRIFCNITQKSYSKNRSVLILVHRVELLNQTVAALDAVGILAVPFTDKRKTIGRVTVCMIESLKTTLGRSLFADAKFDLIIVDEAHLGNFAHVFDIFPNNTIIGFTATPVAAKKDKPLKNLYEEIVIGADIGELIEKGILARCLTVAPVTVDESSLDVGFDGDYTDESQMTAMSTKVVYDGIIEAYKKYAPHQKTIVYCVNIAHSKETAQKIINVGFNARHIDGTSTRKDKSLRAETLKWFHETDDAILCNCELLTTGFDEPSIRCVILNFCSTSVTKVLQCAGRAGRSYPNKPQFICIDAGENYERTGGTWDEYRDWHHIFWNPPQKKEAQEKKSKKCKECDAVISIHAKFCPYCEVTLIQEEIPIEQTSAPVAEFAVIERKDVLKLSPTVMTLDQLFERAKIGNGTIPYKPSWIVYKILERTDRYEVKTMLLEYATRMEYKKGWAFYQLGEWDKLQKEKEQLLDIA